MPQACSKEPPWDQSSSSPRQTRIDGLVKRKAKAALQWQATGYIVGRPKGNDPTTGEGGYFPCRGATLMPSTFPSSVAAISPNVTAVPLRAL